MGEINVTWSSIEKDYDYNKVIWGVHNNGIPVYSLLNENGEKIEIGEALQ